MNEPREDMPIGNDSAQEIENKIMNLSSDTGEEYQEISKLDSTEDTPSESLRMSDDELMAVILRNAENRRNFWKNVRQLGRI